MFLLTRWDACCFCGLRLEGLVQQRKCVCHLFPFSMGIERLVELLKARLACWRQGDPNSAASPSALVSKPSWTSVSTARLSQPLSKLVRRPRSARVKGLLRPTSVKIRHCVEVVPLQHATCSRCEWACSRATSRSKTPAVGVSITSLPVKLLLVTTLLIASILASKIVVKSNNSPQ